MTEKGAKVAGIAAGVVTAVASAVADSVVSSVGSTEKGKKLSRTATIAREGVRGVVEVYEAMEEAAKVVLASFQISGSTYVSHKYG